MRHRFPSMGTVLEVQLVITCDKKPPPSFWLEIQAELEQIEAQMSLYQSQSALRRLNRAGQLNPAPIHLLKVTQEALTAAHLTKGAFDPTILPALQLIEQSFTKKGSPPPISELKALRPLIDYRHATVDDHRIILSQGRAISLDGIAKGYSVDVIANKLEDDGYMNYLINFSGNMRWRGQRADNTPWRIKIWDVSTDSLVDFKTPSSGAISSSGGYNRSYSEDKLWHHIIDPRHLRPASRWLATSVFGPRATTCDFLSTASFVMSERDISIISKKSFPTYKFWVANEKKSKWITGEDAPSFE